MDQDRQTRRAIRIQEKYNEQLMALPNVVGTAVGLRKRQGQFTDQVALVVMVARKLPRASLATAELVPRELEGVPVDVLETGAFHSL
ncbi:MAG: hypothetical protein OXG07_00290 [Anaerolineaceae bacterium]|nr:hypothetical protein [Anaerolineaceae bacterium]MCY3907305.1 hypothetical protein [Anaerolineaceae bacterium]MDE0609116.1 hypothetical protein [Anaerolineaceae bacterium]